MNGLVRKISGLSIITTSELPRLNKGQKALLTLIRKCVEEKKSLSFELIVKCYYDNVRKKFQRGTDWCRIDPDDWRSARYTKYEEHDILECFKDGSLYWYWRPHIKSWFKSTIGCLVVKNQLVIVPTIDLGEEDSDGQ